MYVIHIIHQTAVYCHHTRISLCMAGRHPIHGAQNPNNTIVSAHTWDNNVAHAEDPTAPIGIAHFHTAMVSHRWVLPLVTTTALVVPTFYMQTPPKPISVNAGDILVGRFYLKYSY